MSTVLACKNELDDVDPKGLQKLLLLLLTELLLLFVDVLAISFVEFYAKCYEF